MRVLVENGTFDQLKGPGPQNSLQVESSSLPVGDGGKDGWLYRSYMHLLRESSGYTVSDWHRCHFLPGYLSIVQPYPVE